MRWPWQKEKRAAVTHPFYIGGSDRLGRPSNAAIQIAALHRCVAVISENIASLPIHVYQNTKDGSVPKPNHPLQSLLYLTPNKRMIPFTFWQTTVENTVLLGDGFVEILRDQAARPYELWPLDTKATRVETEDDGTPRYTFTKDKSEYRLKDRDVMHIPGSGYDGLRGTSMLERFRTVFGITVSADVLAESYFRQGAKPSGVLSTPDSMSPEAEKNLIDGWRRLYEGAHNAGRIMMLQQGIKFDPLSVNFSDSEFLKNREFQVAEVCRVFGVPMHMVMAAGGTYASDEARTRDFYALTLRPWIVRLEQAINKSLLMPSERGRLFVKFEVGGLLRADVDKRNAAYAIAKQNGWMSTNEIRRLEDLAPIEGGDTYYVPLNMVPVGEAAKLIGDGEPGSVRK